MKNSVYSFLLCSVMIAMTSFTNVKPQKSEIKEPLNLGINISETDKVQPVKNGAANFQSGEEIVYKIYYNWNFVWLPAGEVIFNVTDDGANFHFNARGRSYSTYNWFFKVDDDYDTYADRNTLLPSVAIRDIHEGGYHLYDKVTFDQNQQISSYARGPNKDKIEHTGTVPLGDYMRDILSIIYYTRTMNFESLNIGQSIPVKLLLDEEIYPLSVKYKGKEEKNIKGLGKFSTLQFTPDLIAGHVFKPGTEMKVWASDDLNKIPLMIESPVSLGSVKVVLKSWKGLKYDLSSKK